MWFRLSGKRGTELSGYWGALLCTVQSGAVQVCQQPDGPWGSGTSGMRPAVALHRPLDASDSRAPEAFLLSSTNRSSDTSQTMFCHFTDSLLRERLIGLIICSIVNSNTQPGRKELSRWEDRPLLACDMSRGLCHVPEACRPKNRTSLKNARPGSLTPLCPWPLLIHYPFSSDFATTFSGGGRNARRPSLLLPRISLGASVAISFDEGVWSLRPPNLWHDQFPLGMSGSTVKP